MNLAHWLERQARANAAAPALYLGKDCLADYGALWAQARSVAGWLADLGVRPGDRVAIFMKNVPEYLTVFYGIWALGAVVVPINAKLHAKEAAFILKDSGAGHVFASPDLACALHALGIAQAVTPVPGPAFDAITKHRGLDAIAHRSPDDLAWLFYTSGTTGQPKGVCITHRMLTVMSLCYLSDVDTVSPADCILYAAPMSHGAGIYNMLHVRVGARHICPVSQGFDPDEIFDLAGHHDRMHLFAAPTMVKRMTDVARRRAPKVQGLRTVVYAGGPMYNADIIDAVDYFGPIFVQIYGQGECPMGISALTRAEVADREHPNWEARLQSVGRAQSAVEVAIGSPGAEPLPLRTHGEIMVRGDTVMPGYWQNQSATSKTLVNGWLMTGDIGFMDAEGYITLQDRSKDMIITGGSNVYPREVEEVLLRAPAVQEVSVVAFVVGDCDPVELDRLCLEHIARFKRPKAYIPIDALPKNNYGKVLKTNLRARLKDEGNP